MLFILKDLFFVILLGQAGSDSCDSKLGSLKCTWSNWLTLLRGGSYRGGGGCGDRTVQYTHFDTFYANGLDHGTF